MNNFVSYYGLIRTDIAPMLPSQAEAILDVGCGEGRTLEWAAEQLGAGTRVGVDISETSLAAAASCGAATHLINLNETPSPEPVGIFDLVLALDVLEHLVDPWAAVAWMTSQLRPGGRLIISVPNIRYYEASLGLVLRDRWELGDSGIFDRTHLRFFVHKTAVELATSAGLKATHVIDKRRSRRDRVLNAATLSLASSLFAFQILVAADKEV